MDAGAGGFERRPALAAAPTPPGDRAAGAAVGFSRLRDRFAAVALSGKLDDRRVLDSAGLLRFRRLSADPAGVWPTPLVRFSRRRIHARYGHLRRPRAGDPSGAFRRKPAVQARFIAHLDDALEDTRWRRFGLWQLFFGIQGAVLVLALLRQFLEIHGGL